MTFPQSIVLYQWKLKTVEQKEVANSSKTIEEEFKQVKKRWTFIGCQHVITQVAFLI